MLAGRNAARGRRGAGQLNAQIETAQLDVFSPALTERLRTIAPRLAINAAGPFQSQDYCVAQACAEAGVDYVDLADSRRFVTGFASALDHLARRRGVALVTGASSVPALSCAAVDELADGMQVLESIDIGIAPGNRTRRGLATVKAILSCCGAPVRVWQDGDWSDQRGWNGTYWHTYPAPVGRRPLSLCDVPDLDLLVDRHAPIQSVIFRAGLELGLLHRAMNLFARLRGAGIVRDWTRYAGALHAASKLFRPFGSDTGAMHVRVEGIDDDGKRASRLWQLVALNGHGPYVPTLAAAAIVRRYLAGNPLPAGAYPCAGVLSLQDFVREQDGLCIHTEVSEH